MAEPDAAGREPPNGPVRTQSFTLAELHRDIERATAPLRAAMEEAERATAPLRAAAEQAERSVAPLRAAAEQAKRHTAAIESGFGLHIRQMLGEGVAAAPRPPYRATELPRPTAGPNGPSGSNPVAPTPPPPPPEFLFFPGGDAPAADPPLALLPPPTTQPSPTLANATETRHRLTVLDTSPEAMAALVARVAEAVVERLAARNDLVANASPAKGRRGRRRREISVGGVDAALEALAEEDRTVRVLAARALEERIPYGRRTIEKCDTYKAWRRDLRALRVEAEAEGVADVLDTGLASIRKKKPGRGRLVDPAIDPAVEKMTREFLRFHGEEALGGQ
jgi:hypothetical protein